MSIPHVLKLEKEWQLTQGKQKKMKKNKLMEYKTQVH